MKISNFLYRQRQRALYHLAKNDTDRLIAEINKNQLLIKRNKDHYWIVSLSISIPKNSFDFIFTSFDLFLANAERLNGKYIIVNGKLFFLWDSFQVCISSASELFIIHEIFVDTCYCFRLPTDQKVNVIDIGMNVGLASLYFANLAYVSKVIAFEPFKPTFDLAESNFKLNDTLGLKIDRYNYGLGIKDEILEVPYNAHNSGVSSTQKDNPRNIYASRSEHLQIRKADTTINKVLADHPDELFIIKMDTEGAEYAIVESLLNQSLNRRVIGIMMEWHFKGAQQLEEQLIAQGFKLFSLGLGEKAGLIYGYR